MHISEYVTNTWPYHWKNVLTLLLISILFPFLNFALRLSVYNLSNLRFFGKKKLWQFSVKIQMELFRPFLKLCGFVLFSNSRCMTKSMLGDHNPLKSWNNTQDAVQCSSLICPAFSSVEVFEILWSACVCCYFSKRLGFCQKFVLSDFSICVAYSQGESKGEMGHEDLFLSGDITQWRKVISSGSLLCKNMTFDKRSWTTPTQSKHCIFSFKNTSRWY